SIDGSIQLSQPIFHEEFLGTCRDKKQTRSIIFGLFMDESLYMKFSHFLLLYLAQNLSYKPIMSYNLSNILI
ncbi:hypothetical protein ACJX0J_028360, partial [Zea mays]